MIGRKCARRSANFETARDYKNLQDVASIGSLDSCSRDVRLNSCSNRNCLIWNWNTAMHSHRGRKDKRRGRGFEEPSIFSRPSPLSFPYRRRESSVPSGRRHGKGNAMIPAGDRLVLSSRIALHSDTNSATPKSTMQKQLNAPPASSGPLPHSLGRSSWLGRRLLRRRGRSTTQPAKDVSPGSASDAGADSLQ